MVSVNEPAGWWGAAGRLVNTFHALDGIPATPFVLFGGLRVGSGPPDDALLVLAYVRRGEDRGLLLADTYPRAEADGYAPPDLAALLPGLWFEEGDRPGDGCFSAAWSEDPACLWAAVLLPEGSHPVCMADMGCVLRELVEKGAVGAEVGPGRAVLGMVTKLVKDKPIPGLGLVRRYRLAGGGP